MRKFRSTIRIVRAIAFMVAIALHSIVCITNAVAEPIVSRPITIMIGLPPGGGVDVSLRRYTEAVTRLTGQKFVIENRTGGSGVVAAMAVKQAQPDGATLLLANTGTHATLQWLHDLPFDPVKDFTPVTELYYFPSFMTVPERISANNVGEFVALARTTPGGLTYGSQGVGSNSHLLGAMLGVMSGAPLVHVPYPGGAPMNLDTVLGRLDSSFSTFNFMNEYRKQGKVKFLAVALPERSSRVTDVPTMAEAGFPGIDISTWFGLLAPAGTPPDIIAKLNAAFVQASQDAELVNRLDQQGIEAKTGTPEAFSALMANDAAKIGKTIKAVGVTAN
ncbi:MAG: Bug family tripartite tricarboxylate transporter substrate binding protein [Xanthobacteraceae bacterium]